MTYYQWIILMSYSILPAALAALLLWPKAERIYYPVIYLLWLGLFNEIISTLVIASGKSNALNNNIYALVESLLLLFQFKKWQLFNQRLFLWRLLLVSLLMLWSWENFIYSNINVFDHFFRIGYSTILIGMSILHMRKLMQDYNGRLFNNASFIFCSGFIFYYSINLLLEIFLYYGGFNSNHFRDMIFKSASYINLFVNFIYLTGILCIPRKPQFITE